MDGRVDLQGNPWKTWLLDSAGASLIAYATNPLISAFVITTGVSEGTWTEGTPFMLMALAAVFVTTFLWKLWRPRGRLGFERSVFGAAWMFLLAIPCLIIAGLLLPEASRGAVLTVMGVLYSGYMVVQSAIPFFWGHSIRNRRTAREALGLHAR